MKRMIQIGLVLFWCVFSVSIVWSGIEIDNSDVPLSDKCGCEKKIKGIKPTCLAAFEAGSWSPHLWGLNKEKKNFSMWSPVVAGC